MKKPNPIIHMTGYGILYGFLLALFYIWGVLLWLDSGSGTIITNLWNDLRLVGGFSLVFGTIPGAILGFIEGWIIWFMTRQSDLPFESYGFKKTRNIAMGIVGGLTFWVMGLLVMVLLATLILPLLWILFPPFIAVGISIYATYRYFLRLKAWGDVRKQKIKAEHSSQNELGYEEASDNIDYSEYESDVQEKEQ